MAAAAPIFPFDFSNLHVFSDFPWGEYTTVSAICNKIEKHKLQIRRLNLNLKWDLVHSPFIVNLATCLGLLLPTCPQLTALNVECDFKKTPDIPDEAGTAFASILRSCDNRLTHFGLSRVSLTDISELVCVLKKCTNLQSLELNGNSFGDVGAEQLAGVVFRLEKLTYLDLYDTEITSVGGLALVERLKQCPKLKVLILPHTATPKPGRDNPIRKFMLALTERAQQPAFEQTAILPWNRRIHDVFGEEFDRVFGAFLLGFTRLVCMDDQIVPDVDPEIIAETLEACRRFHLHYETDEDIQATVSFFFAIHSHLDRTPFHLKAARFLAYQFERDDIKQIKIDKLLIAEKKFPETALKEYKAIENMYIHEREKKVMESAIDVKSEEYFYAPEEDKDKMLKDIEDLRGKLRLFLESGKLRLLRESDELRRLREGDELRLLRESDELRRLREGDELRLLQEKQLAMRAKSRENQDDA